MPANYTTRQPRTRANDVNINGDPIVALASLKKNARKTAGKGRP